MAGTRVPSPSISAGAINAGDTHRAPMHGRLGGRRLAIAPVSRETLSGAPIPERHSHGKRSHATADDPESPSGPGFGTRAARSEQTATPYTFTPATHGRRSRADAGGLGGGLVSTAGRLPSSRSPVTAWAADACWPRSTGAQPIAYCNCAGRGGVFVSRVVAHRRGCPSG